MRNPLEKRWAFPDFQVALDGILKTVIRKKKMSGMSM
jgi:hypothetical protein